MCVYIYMYMYIYIYIYIYIAEGCTRPLHGALRYCRAGAAEYHGNHRTARTPLSLHLCGGREDLEHLKLIWVGEFFETPHPEIPHP